MWGLFPSHNLPLTTKKQQKLNCVLVANWIPFQIFHAVAFTWVAKASDCSVLAGLGSRNSRDEPLHPRPPPSNGSAAPPEEFTFLFLWLSRAFDSFNRAGKVIPQSRRNCNGTRWITPLFICRGTLCVSALFIWVSNIDSRKKVLNQLWAVPTKFPPF